ncbi:MAG: toluene hydroxylase [Sandaracinaceae bacterium]
MGNLGRVPTEYEIVTHGMNHTAIDDERLPLEMGPSRHGNRWLTEHRNEAALRAESWDGFRDPDQITYRAYNKMQDESETYVDRLLQELTEEKQCDRDLDPAWLEGLGVALAPQRYPVHALQMLATYTTQMAPSSYIANCASFQAADELRRVQRIAYRTKQLQMAYPDRGFGERERGLWEDHPHWQGVRKALENALVAYDWDRSFAAVNLVLKPAYDHLFLRELAGVARQRGDDLDALVLEALHHDAERSRTWSAALARYAVGARAENLDVLRGYVEEWTPLAEELVQGGASLLAEAGGADGSTIATRTRERLAAFHAEAGLA